MMRQLKENVLFGVCTFTDRDIKRARNESFPVSSILQLILILNWRTQNIYLMIRFLLSITNGMQLL